MLIFFNVSYFFSTFVEVKVHLCPTGGSQLHHWSEICLSTRQKNKTLLTSCYMKTAGRSGREEINNNTTKHTFFIHQKVQYKFPYKCNL